MDKNSFQACVKELHGDCDRFAKQTAGKTLIDDLRGFDPKLAQLMEKNHGSIVELRDYLATRIGSQS